MNATLKRIEQLLNQYNWNKYRLAKQSGIPYSSLNSLFQKNYQPSISTLEKICSGFGISLSEFFADDLPPVNPSAFYTDDEVEFITNYRRLSARDKKLVSDFIDMLCSKVQ